MKTEKKSPDSLYGEDKEQIEYDRLQQKKADDLTAKIDNEFNKRNGNLTQKEPLHRKKIEENSTVDEIAEILKNNTIDQIVIAGEKINLPESKEKLQGLKPDLDAYTALYLLNNYNKKSLEDTYGKYSKTSIVKKDGTSEDFHGDKNISEKLIERDESFINKYKNDDKESIRVFVDTGGEWLKVEKEGETTTIYIDHHGEGKRLPTSGTKMMMEIMEKAGILKEVPLWLHKFTEFVNDIDNLSYLEKEKNGKKIFNESYFRNEWPNSMNALAEKQIPFETFLELCESGKIKDPSKSFTEDDLNGELGNYKIGENTIKDLCRIQREEVNNTLIGIKNSIDHNTENGLHLETKELGKIIYHDYFKIKGKSNIILDHLAMKATVAKGFNTYISWNENKKYKRFFINSVESKSLDEITKRLNAVDPGCALEIRGSFIFGKINNLTEEQFLNIISPDILKNVKPKIDKKNKTINTSETNKKDEKTPEVITDGEFNNFVDSNLVDEKIIKDIAEKHKNQKPLSTREEAIFNNNIQKVEKILLEKKDLENKVVKEEKSDTITTDTETESVIVKNETLEEKKVIEKTQESKVEKNLEIARERYFSEYTKCKKEADKQNLITRTKNKILNIFRSKENQKETKLEDFFTEELNEQKKEYDKARIEKGNEMYSIKKAELEKSGLTGKDLDTALTKYKATEILSKIIIEEKQKLLDIRAESAPVKIALWKKMLDGYMKIKPRWKRVALSTALFTAAAGAGIVTGGMFAGYGLATMAGMKFGYSMAIGAFAGHSAKGIDWAKSGADERFKKEQNENKLKLQEQFSKNEISIEKYEEGIVSLELAEKKRARNRTLLKAGVGIAIAGTAGFMAYDAMGHGISHAAVDATSGPAVPHFISHGTVEATADHGQGAISTIKELQHNLKVEYGNNIENAPASVKHILNTDAHKLAQEYGMYKPGQDAESVLIKSGEKFTVDGNGNVKFENTLLEKGSDLKGSATYEGRMVDTDHSGMKTGGNLNQDTLNQKVLPNESMQDSLNNNVSPSEINGETIISGDNTTGVNQDLINNEVLPDGVNQDIINNNVSPEGISTDPGNFIDNVDNLKHLDFQNPDHVISLTDNNASLKMQFHYDPDGNVDGVDVGGNTYNSGENPYVLASEIQKLDNHTQLDADIDIFKMTSEARFLDKIPQDTYEYKYLLHEVVGKQKDIIENYGNVLNPDKLVGDAAETVSHVKNAVEITSEQLKLLNDENIHHLFPGENGMKIWENIKNNPVRTSIDIKVTDVAKNYTDFISQIHKIHNVTGLSPDINESNGEYIIRATKYLAEKGRLNEIKL